MLALAAPPDIRWCEHGVRALAHRIAGRLLDVDALPRALADALLVEVLAVLDWVRAA